MIMDKAEQGTPEWYQARAKVITASNFDKCLMGISSKTRTDYMIRKATENLTDRPAPAGYQSYDMRRGTELEPDARDYYTLLTGRPVKQAGLCYLNELKLIGASVDGLVGDEGLLEIKCPKLNTHVHYMMNGVMPQTYIEQVQGQLWVTARKWCDFFSYNPDSHKMHFMVRVMRDNAYIQRISTAVYKFIGELEVLTEKMRNL